MKDVDPTTEFSVLLLLTMLPALSTFLGGLLADSLRISQRSLSLTLHGVAGVILGMVGVELMPHAIQADPPWVIVLAFVAGGGLFMIIDRATGLIGNLIRGINVGKPALALFVGLALHLLTDGVLLSASAVVSFRLGLLLAVGMAIMEIPQGFIAISAFRRRGVARGACLVLAFILGLAIPLGAIAGFAVVLGQPQIVQLGMLSFTAGMLVALVVEEIVPEAHINGEAREATLFLISGFALFVLLTIYLG